jgi:lipopolysaccharide transport system ATP-binding protein
MDRPIIEVRKLSKVYRMGAIGATRLKDDVERLWNRLRGRHEARRKGEFKALDDVSFDLQPGQVLGIIGRNGAGKSTLLKILSRITQQTAGEIVLRGRVASLLEVGTGFHPDLTGRENIFLNGAILGMTRAEIRKKLDEIIAFAEVAQFIDTPVKRYSSGMYVRLAFAVAAHLEPEILVVDEVLAVGDVQFQKKCIGKMAEVAHRGRTVLFVSHNMAAVRNLCTRALLLDQGRNEMEGTPDGVIAHYLANNSGALSAIIELPPGEDPGVRATAIRLSTSEGAPQALFKIGEPWKIQVEFELGRGLRHVIAAVGLRSMESVPLVTWWSAPGDLSAGRYMVEFECDIPFSAGEISFVVGISSQENTLYHAEGAGGVAISEIAIREQPLRSSGTGIIATTQRPAIRELSRELPCSSN